ncbi:MAG: hypothetical protein KKE43_04410 [Actinobacteria bacterium]|nr:hypothetical protein [Actinomycetota bacterium]MBU4240724.1 hypothetical protein [Actinomycetota bacterium]
MRKCRRCGFPVKFARCFDWRADGTIVSTDRTKTRSQITFLEDGELEGLFSDLTGTIGISVEPFLVQAQKEVGKAISASLPLRHMKRVPHNRFFRPQWVARLLVRLVATDMAGLGDGRISVDSYRAGKSLVLRFKNPCLAPLLAGSAAGIYESVEEMPSSNIDYGIEGEDLVIRLSHGEEKAESESRLYLEEAGPGDGPLGCDRCQVCLTPLPASRALQWDLGRGIINNRLTGQREVVVASQSVNAILWVLETELGGEIPRILYEHQKSYTRERLAGKETGDPERFWEDHLRGLAFRGLGYPTSFRHNGSSVSVGILNPYNQDLYAAKIAAALEAVTGTASSIEWKKRTHHDCEYEITADSIEA